MNAFWFLGGFILGMLVFSIWTLRMARQTVQRLQAQHDKEIDEAWGESYHNGLEWARTDPATVRRNYNAMFGSPRP
jgi:hypothetical protein